MPDASSWLKRKYWRLRYARWPRRDDASKAGYTVLVPVPGDLPVMTRVALAVLREQDAVDRRATLVIADQHSDAVVQAVAEAAEDWPGELRFVPLAADERWLLPRLGDPGKNHAAQLCRGVSASKTSHVILHDADLFMVDPGMHDSLYRACSRADAAVCGVEGVWDPWFASHERRLLATWELCCDVTWVRRFRPYRHFAHVASAEGEQHVFDTTLWPQWSTDQSRLSLLEEKNDFVHFNYVISTYRHFRRSRTTFHDENFRLLLLRVMIDLFDETSFAYEVPSINDLGAGLTGASDRVFYRSADAEQYRLMRRRLGIILSGPWVPRPAAEIKDLLAAFDQWAAETPGSDAG